MSERFDAIRQQTQSEVSEDDSAVWIIYKYFNEEGQKRAVIVSSACRSAKDVEDEIARLIADLEKSKRKAIKLIKNPDL